jgi:hypothetical protein
MIEAYPTVTWKRRLGWVFGTVRSRRYLVAALGIVQMHIRFPRTHTVAGAIWRRDAIRHETCHQPGKSMTGRDAAQKIKVTGSLANSSSLRQSHAAKQLLKTGIGVKLIEHWINFQVDHLLVMFLEGLL